MTERELQKQLRNYHKTQIMSVELAVELLEGCSLDCMYTDETFDAKQMAIKALTILNKIRKEIENIAFDWQEIDGEHESFMVVGLNDMLQIIDKYKAEGEVEK